MRCLFCSQAVFSKKVVSAFPAQSLECAYLSHLRLQGALVGEVAAYGSLGEEHGDDKSPQPLQRKGWPALLPKAIIAAALVHQSSWLAKCLMRPETRRERQERTLTLLGRRLLPDGRRFSLNDGVPWPPASLATTTTLCRGRDGRAEGSTGRAFSRILSGRGVGWRTAGIRSAVYQNSPNGRLCMCAGQARRSRTVQQNNACGIR